MDRTREQRPAGRRALAGGIAVTATAVVAVWGAPAGAGTASPTAFAVCTPSDAGNRISGRLADFPANQSFRSLMVMDGQRGGFSIDGLSTGTDANGAYTTPGGPDQGIPFSELPVTLGWIVYRDVNSNGRYDDQVDETVYRGDGTVTACPQTVTLSPK